MPDPVTGLVVGGTQLIGGAMKSSAANKAGQIQSDAAMAGVAEQRRQFDAFQQILKPYVDLGLSSVPGLTPYLDAGTGSIAGLEEFLSAGSEALPGLQAYAEGGNSAYQRQLDMLGLNGPEAQAAAIAGFEKSPMFQAIAGQGEDAILQNASATGGVRGGNVQGALAQFRPQLLKQLLDEQYGRLGGIAGAGLGVNSDLVSMGAQGRQNLFGIGSQMQQNLVKLGQNSAAGTGAAGMSTGANVAQLLAESGAARAGAKLSGAEAWGGALNLPAQYMGLKMGMGGSGALF